MNNDELIKKMVNRFLAWKLPANFAPDAGITFKADYNQDTPYPMRHEPIGTNLFTADQAKAMFEYLLCECPFSGCRKVGRCSWPKGLKIGTRHPDASSAKVSTKENQNV
jgi:hypothetical protein